MRCSCDSVHILQVRSQALEPDGVPIVSWELTETKIEYSSDLWTEKYFFLKQGWLERDDSLVKDIFCSSGTCVQFPVLMSDSS